MGGEDAGVKAERPQCWFGFTASKHSLWEVLSPSSGKKNNIRKYAVYKRLRTNTKCLKMKGQENTYSRCSLPTAVLANHPQSDGFKEQPLTVLTDSVVQELGRAQWERLVSATLCLEPQWRRFDGAEAPLPRRLLSSRVLCVGRDGLRTSSAWI